MLWVKAFHIMAMVAWFSGLFYLPRLFVYHADTKDDISHERFKIMESRLYRAITTPAAVITILLGLWLISYNPKYYGHAGWMHLKLSLVVLLIFYHFYLGRCLKRFANNTNKHSSKYFRVINEVPTLFLFSIVILVVVRPF